MARGVPLEWPSDRELAKLYESVGGNRSAVARSLGRTANQLQKHVDRNPALRALLEQIKTRAPTALEGEVSEVELLRAEIKELRRVATARRKTDVRDERIIRSFERATEKVKPKYRPARFAGSGKLGAHEHVLLLSDLHAGEVVTREETLGLNAYSWDVMLERLERVQRSVLSYQAHRPYPIRRLNVWMLGDMISGSIHDDLEVTNEFGHEQTVVQLGADLADWLERFVPYYESVKVTGVVGNHARRHRQPRAKRAATENSDWTVYKFVEVHHRRNPALEFSFPNAKYASTMIAERWRALLVHGDGVRSTMVDVPFGGVIRYSQKLEAQFHKAGRPLDYIACGHWHSINAIDGIGTKLYINGSVKGVDEWSLQRFGSGRPPGQVLLTAHPKRGITDLSYIDCEDTVPNSEARAA